MSPKYADPTAPPPRRVYSAVTVVILSVIIAILFSAVVALSWLLLQLSPPADDSYQLRARWAKSAVCVVSMDEHRVVITPEQAGNVSVIVAESIRRGLPPRAATIALVTAWQESTLRNLDYGDLDSLGLFQQRPSQGWGTPEQVMDPWYSSGKFYDALVRVYGWENADITETAQAVQRSAYPDAYRQHEWKGRVWVSTLTGWAEETITCRVNLPAPGDTVGITEFFRNIYGEALPISVAGNQVSISAPDAVAAWAIGQLAIARIGVDGVIGVQIDDRLWLNDPWDYGRWMRVSDIPAGAPKNQIVITVNA
jgi:hypothetical protein